VNFDFAEAVVDAATLAAVRARLAAARFERYDNPDRGRYELNQTHDEPDLVARLLRHAWTRLGGAVLRPVSRRWTRLRRGDYALFKDDARRWAGGDYELCLDLSAAPSREGQIVYAAPDGGATVPQRPGGVALIDRRGPVARYERYLGIRFGDGEIVRLALVLVPA
jgi:hypothetical protein